MIDKAIRNIYPSVVSIRNSTDAFDKDDNLVTLDKEKIDLEVSRLKSIKYEKDELAKLKTQGEFYLDTEYKVSFTSDDALGLLQVKTAFELGVTSTNIEFINGTIMPISANDFQDFAVWFANKRNSFFV